MDALTSGTSQTSPLLDQPSAVCPPGWRVRAVLRGWGSAHCWVLREQAPRTGVSRPGRSPAGFAGSRRGVFSRFRAHRGPCNRHRCRRTDVCGCGWCGRGVRVVGSWVGVCELDSGCEHHNHQPPLWTPWPVLAWWSGLGVVVVVVCCFSWCVPNVVCRAPCSWSGALACVAPPGWGVGV